jgi:hypothetical protein
LQQAESASLTMKVPDIQGATVVTQGYVVDPAGDVDPTTDRKLVAWSGPKAITAGQVTISTNTPPQNVVPGPHASASSKAGAISWDPAPSTLAFVALSDRTNNRTIAAVWTEGANVSFARLGELGVVLGATAATLDLSTFSAVDLATLTAASSSSRKIVYDWSTAGASSTQQWQFQLTP